MESGHNQAKESAISDTERNERHPREGARSLGEHSVRACLHGLADQIADRLEHAKEFGGKVLNLVALSADTRIAAGKTNVMSRRKNKELTEEELLKRFSPEMVKAFKIIRLNQESIRAYRRLLLIRRIKRFVGWKLFGCMDFSDDVDRGNLSETVLSETAVKVYRHKNISKHFAAECV